MSKKKKKVLYDRTISEELLKQWKALVRVGDVEKLMEILDLSRPTINKALIYGNVHQDRIVQGITNFFKERIDKETKLAEGLKNTTA